VEIVEALEELARTLGDIKRQEEWYCEIFEKAVESMKSKWEELARKYGLTDVHVRVEVESTEPQSRVWLSFSDSSLNVYVDYNLEELEEVGHSIGSRSVRFRKLYAFAINYDKLVEAIRSKASELRRNWPEVSKALDEFAEKVTPLVVERELERS